jgi:hypothetical protein
MTMSEGNGSARRRFEVHCSGTVAKRLRRLQEAASPTERKQIAVAFETIVQKLKSDPNQVGEPFYRLAELRLQVRTVVLGPLAITFAVSEDRPLVFIKSGSKLGGSGREARQYRSCDVR